MLKQLERFTKKISEAKGERNVLKTQLQEIIQERKYLKSKLETAQEAKILVQTVAKQTQKIIEKNISELVTSTLSSVFPEPYTFKLRFEERKNKTEADLIFLKGENETDDILFTGGGGVADVASFILGIAVFSINPTRPIIIRDESFKFLHSPEFQEKTSAMIKKISDEFGIQIIIISDQKNLYKYADKVIHVEILEGESFVGEAK